MQLPPEQAPLLEVEDEGGGEAGAAAEGLAAGGGEEAPDPSVPELAAPPAPASGVLLLGEDAAGAADEPAEEPSEPEVEPDEDPDEPSEPPGTPPPLRPVKLIPCKFGRLSNFPLFLAPEMLIGAQFI